MRKYSGFAFLLLVFCSLAFLSEQGRFSPVRISGSFFAEGHHDISAGTISLPHTDVEFSHIQNGFQAPRHEPRKSSLQVSFESQKTATSDYPASPTSLPEYREIKKYLTHIHPTHHFW